MEGLKKEFPGQVEYLAGDLADFEVCFLLFCFELFCRCFLNRMGNLVDLRSKWVLITRSVFSNLMQD